MSEGLHSLKILHCIRMIKSEIYCRKFFVLLSSIWYFICVVLNLWIFENFSVFVIFCVYSTEKFRKDISKKKFVGQQKIQVTFLHLYIPQLHCLFLVLFVWKKAQVDMSINLILWVFWCLLVALYQVDGVSTSILLKWKWIGKLLRQS